jgi:hypothetical protein
MKKPEPPLYRIIQDGIVGECPYCESSLKYKFGLFKTDKCIHPKCQNYYDLDWISVIMKRNKK